MICFESHATNECPERKNQHCPDCHVFIRVCADHTSVCGMRTWAYKKYAHLYVKRPKERCIFNINAPFRFLLNGCWRKGNDGLVMYSPASGAFFNYRSEYDLCLLSNHFVGIRIVVVIKESGKFVEKLVLLTSKTQLIVATHVNNEFIRNANHQHSTLILAMSAEDKPIINVNVFPNAKPVREFILEYDQGTKQFKIPLGLRISVSDGIDMYGNDAQTNAQLHGKSDVGAQCLQLMEVNAEMRSRLSNVGSENSAEPNRIDVNCMVCFGLHHSLECQKGVLENCYECHVPIQYSDEHAQNCGAKKLFLSEKIGKYVKIPSIRCIISFLWPINIWLNGQIQAAQPGMRLFSSISDTYYEFESNRKVILMTTGFSRVRMPIVVQEGMVSVEKLALMTSSDRVVVAALGSRIITDDNLVGDYEHNTPLVLQILDDPSNISVEIHSAGGNVHKYEIEYRYDTKKFAIPAELDVKSKRFPVMKFDAALPTKIKRNW